jgi:Zinc finger, C3HC4 type (RING finger)
MMNICTVYIYVAVGMNMSAEVEHASDRTVRTYASLDEKVDLLIERMSECVRFVREYMNQNRMEDGEYHPGDRVVFGEMLRDFSPCIVRLRDCQRKLQTARMMTWPLQSARATELNGACSMIYTFHNNSWDNTSAPELSHIRNEMQNLIRFEQNLYPKAIFGGFTRLNTTQGPLIKWFREDTEEVVIVSELAWLTECVVCFQREREVVLYPCTHWCLCRECKRSVYKCPICRARITTDRAIGDVQREKLPFIQASQFPGSEESTRRLLIELQALGSGEN